MINYNKNKLINTCLVKYYETFALTLDTADFVPEKYNKKILAYIFKNMKRQFRKVDKADRLRRTGSIKKNWREKSASGRNSPPRTRNNEIAAI